MKDEIKEMNLSEMLFNRDERLLDYITNLQEENKKISNQHLSAINKLIETQEENERLELELSGYREAILKDDKMLGLKSRIDKAVEYIENDLKSFLYSIEYKTLLNILNGDK